MHTCFLFRHVSDVIYVLTSLFVFFLAWCCNHTYFCCLLIAFYWPIFIINWVAKNFSLVDRVFEMSCSMSILSCFVVLWICSLINFLFIFVIYLMLIYTAVLKSAVLCLLHVDIAFIIINIMHYLHIASMVFPFYHSLQYCIDHIAMP